MKTGITLLLIQAWLAAAGSGAAPAADPARAKIEYQNWIDCYAEKSLIGRAMDGKPAPLKLVVTNVERDELKAQGRETTSVTEMTMDGQVSFYTPTLMGIHGGGNGTPLPAATLARLDGLLAALPDDGSQLPPGGRRVLLQAVVGDQTKVRVYDRANLPEAMCEVLRLGRYSIRAYVPTYRPDSEINARGRERGGFLSLTPDGKHLLFTAANQPLQFWQSTTHELLDELRGLGGDSIAFSPDGSKAVVSDRGNCKFVDTRTWSFTRKQSPSQWSQFTPDGRFALLACRNRPMEIYDATTWERLDHLPDLPEDTVRYEPAPKGSRAVLQSKAGTISLWDAAQRREIVKLRDHAEISQVAFAPDESLVAVSSWSTIGNDSRDRTRIDLWQTDSGALVHELRPFEQAVDFSIGTKGLLWSPDGQYVLTATTTPAFFGVPGIHVFNARTGRHRGQFSGATNVNGLVLVPESGQLAVGDEDGSIRFWDLPAALKKIRDFEDSFLPASPP